MRNTVIAGIVAVLFAGTAASAIGQPVQLPSVTMLDVGLIDGHILRVNVATAGLDPKGAESPDITLDAWLGDARVRGSLLLTHLPPRFSMDIDFPAGAVRVGFVKVGEFAPVRPFTDNMRFPVQVTVRQGSRVATARRIVTLLLPTVVVPGVANELGRGDQESLPTFIQHGYRDDERAPTVFWFGYPSHQVCLLYTSPSPRDLSTARMPSSA